MRKATPIILLLLIPAMIALGHDIYLFVSQLDQNQIINLDTIREDFKFSALGFIWASYEPESLKTIAQSMDKDDWLLYENFLTFKAFFVGLGFAGIFIILFTVLKFFNHGPFADPNAASKGPYKFRKNKPKF